MSDYPSDLDFLPKNLRHIETLEPFACPIGVALWEEYRRRNPDGAQGASSGLDGQHGP